MAVERRATGGSTLAGRPAEDERSDVIGIPDPIDPARRSGKDIPDDETLTRMRRGAAAISFPIPAEPAIRIDPATGHPPVELFYDSIADEFDDETFIPVKKLGSAFVAELFHGPTFCFKDMGRVLNQYYHASMFLLEHCEI